MPHTWDHNNLIKMPLEHLLVFEFAEILPAGEIITKYSNQEASVQKGYKAC